LLPEELAAVGKAIVEELLKEGARVLICLEKWKKEAGTGM